MYSQKEIRGLFFSEMRVPLYKKPGQWAKHRIDPKIRKPSKLIVHDREHYSQEFLASLIPSDVDQVLPKIENRLWKKIYFPKYKMSKEEYCRGRTLAYESDHGGNFREYDEDGKITLEDYGRTPVRWRGEKNPTVSRVISSKPIIAYMYIAKEHYDGRCLHGQRPGCCALCNWDDRYNTVAAPTPSMVRPPDKAGARWGRSWKQIMKDEYEKQTHWAWGSYYLRSEFKGDNVVKTLCENCENREDCERAGLSKCREAWRHKRVAKSLCCEASALHAKKDDVPLKEKLLSHPITFGLWPDILRPSQGSSFRQEVYEKSTKIQRKILTLLAFERNKKQICEELGMTEHSLNEHLSQIKKTVKKCQKTLTLSS